jgi:hypothetical protein
MPPPARALSPYILPSGRPTHALFCLHESKTPNPPFPQNTTTPLHQTGRPCAGLSARVFQARRGGTPPREWPLLNHPRSHGCWKEGHEGAESSRHFFSDDLPNFTKRKTYNTRHAAVLLLNPQRGYHHGLGLSSHGQPNLMVAPPPPFATDEHDDGEGPRSYVHRESLSVLHSARGFVV